MSPVCFVCLFVPFSATEAPRALAAAAAGAGALGRLLALSAAAAFGLNAAVYLLVGRAGALTLNVAGVVKDVGLIAASVALHGYACVFCAPAACLWFMFVHGYFHTLIAVASHRRNQGPSSRSPKSSVTRWRWRACE